jgi:hypothetical protein
MVTIKHFQVRGIDHVLDGVELTRRHPQQRRELYSHVVMCRCRR